MISLFLLCAMHPFESAINELVESNPHQMNAQEYNQIAKNLVQRGPCHLLVFGTGRDSELYLQINAGGTTLFIEDNPEWIAYAKAHNPTIDIVQVSYKTHRFEAKKYLQLEHLHDLDLELPQKVIDTVWDVIIVDAPAGYNSQCPGRMQSIYAAAKLAQRGCDVFVHDCDRAVERLYTDHLFSRKDLAETYGRTRHYVLSN